MTLQEQIEFLQAIQGGKQVQFRPKNSGNVWVGLNTCTGSACYFEPKYEYRIKPEPEIRYINLYSNGVEHVFKTEEDANRNREISTGCFSATKGRTAKFIEVLE